MRSQQQLNNLSPTAAATANCVTKKHLPNGYPVSNAATLPLSLNVQHSQTITSTMAAVATNGAGLQIISNGTGKNGLRSHMIELNNDQHSATIINGNGKSAKEQIKLEALSSKMDSEPPTKVIKLINGGTIALASVDKDNKLIPSGQVTVQQMVVSHIPLLASSQALRVIGQAPNGLATIELSNANGKLRDFDCFSITCGPNISVADRHFAL